MQMNRKQSTATCRIVKNSNNSQNHRFHANVELLRHCRSWLSWSKQDAMSSSNVCESEQSNWFVCLCVCQRSRHWQIICMIKKSILLESKRTHTHSNSAQMSLCILFPHASHCYPISGQCGWNTILSAQSFDHTNRLRQPFIHSRSSMVAFSIWCNIGDFPAFSLLIEPWHELCYVDHYGSYQGVK